jgi:hypothetical protein
MVDGGPTGTRHMEHPWAVSFGTAVVVALLGVPLAPIDGETFGFTWGSHVGTVLVPATALGLFLSRRAWPLWVAAGTGLALFAVVLAGVAYLRAAVSGPELASPATVGEWSKRYDQGALAAEVQAAGSLARMPAGAVDGEPVVGVYRRGSDRVAVVAFPIGSALARSVRDDPEQGAIDWVNGAAQVSSSRPVDPGPRGGGVACTDETEMRGAIACAWVDRRTVGQVTLVVEGLTFEAAATLVQEFREAVMTGEPDDTGIDAAAGRRTS